MKLSKEDRAVWTGRTALVIIGLISNMYFEIPWFPTLGVACLVGVIVGLIARKVFKPLRMRETKDFMLRIITFGVVMLSVIAIGALYLGIADSPLLDEIIVGWLIPLTVTLTDMRSRFDLVWNDFRKRKKL